MARLQILELPEGSNDERPPFILVVDQVPTSEAGFDALRRDLGTPGDLLERIGARAVLVFEDTIDIPANDTTAYLGSLESRPEVVVKLAGQDVDAAVQKIRNDPQAGLQ
ncbi:hypothetical protein ACFW2V_02585 [Streptomyces sp. NPDC058947]|uniref:hypothetical protein n=1 Tax=Streptomyces sp. NPDC058947 TaxID=3346675 RepID=UPI0036CBC11C